MAWLQRWRQRRQPWQQSKWMALDIETNGLNPEQDAMLSIAWVPIYPPQIALDQSAYYVVNSDTGLNQSAVVHRLSQQDIADGQPLRDVLNAFMTAAEGHCLVAHHVAFDWTVLQKSLRSVGETWRPCGLYCTLQAEKKRLQRRQQAIAQGELTLAQSRSRYGLETFTGHHALHDAIACAELFLAQTYLSNGRHYSSTRSVLKAGR
ncbi:3'-5' exonuclease [Aliidiomarina halalkaliphila]|uniref:3'-5' exonuclease n=1 Tax=Aliidiomarina halalkaliphila TaxID=2593535 RepID=A0A552X5K0_9GAMM|nr:3'-5' exonuclease [Aliidiomarina halalkaliphila]TRW50288.1 3'-5' exonuclease [Aliidiomarina halalkaliphila]